MRKTYKTMTVAAFCFTLLAQTASVSCTDTSSTTGDETIVIHLVNMLEEAVVKGDATVWDSLLAADATMLGRDGNLYKRDEVVAEITPPPSGRIFNITPENMKCCLTSDAAFVSYTANENLIIHGQNMSTQFPCVMYFEKRMGKWQLVYFSYFEKPVDPHSVPVSSEYLSGFTGTYALSQDYKIVVEKRDSTLVYHRLADTNSTVLIPIDTFGRFFRPGSETEFIFCKNDSAQNILRQRRNWIDLIYRKE